MRTLIELLGRAGQGAGKDHDPLGGGVEGSRSAVTLELASGGKAVMAMGGFTGSDPAPTLAEFEKWVKLGDITYYLAGGGMGGGPGGQGSSSQISAWVQVLTPG
jgi:hypothetical protein